MPRTIRPRPDDGFHPIDVQGRDYALVHPDEAHDGGIVLRRVREQDGEDPGPGAREIEGQPGLWHVVMGKIPSPHPSDPATPLELATFWAHVAELPDEASWQRVLDAGFGR